MTRAGAQASEGSGHDVYRPELADGEGEAYGTK